MKFGKTVLASESATCKRNEFPRRSFQVAFVPGGEGGRGIGMRRRDNNGIGIRPRAKNKFNSQDISDCSKPLTPRNLTTTT